MLVVTREREKGCVRVESWIGDESAGGSPSFRFYGAGVHGDSSASMQLFILFKHDPFSKFKLAPSTQPARGCNVSTATAAVQQSTVHVVQITTKPLPFGPTYSGVCAVPPLPLDFDDVVEEWKVVPCWVGLNTGLMACT